MQTSFDQTLPQHSRWDQRRRRVRALEHRLVRALLEASRRPQSGALVRARPRPGARAEQRRQPARDEPGRRSPKTCTRSTCAPTAERRARAGSRPRRDRRSCSDAASAAEPPCPPSSRSSTSAAPASAFDETRRSRRSCERSRRHNARLDVTGCLLFSGHCFAQVLEGAARRRRRSRGTDRRRPAPRRRPLPASREPRASASTPTGRWATCTTSTSRTTSRPCS